MSNFCRAVQKQLPTVQFARQAYHEVYIEFKNKILDYTAVEKSLLQLYTSMSPQQDKQATLWHIPVCYDETLAPDLTYFMQIKQMSLEELIHLHTKSLYTVHFIGFLPGFLYLGGMDPALSLARKDTPSQLIKKGSVAIGGHQTGIYPQDSPGGWHSIGYTPISFFDPQKSAPTWAKAGDKVKFYTIKKTELSTLKIQIQAQDFQIQSEEYHG